MTVLQVWMSANCKLDAEVARAVKMSRPQISRIRRGVTTTTRRTAKELEKLTGIRWWKFLDTPRKRRG